MGRAGGVWFAIIVCKVIVTVLLCGCARQAVSILPTFFVFAAVLGDWFVSMLQRRISVTVRHRRFALSALVGVLLATDIHASRNVTPVRVNGSFQPAPRWGRFAIESYDQIKIAPVDTTPPIKTK